MPKEKDNFLVLSYDYDKCSLEELHTFFNAIRDSCENYNVIALPSIIDLKYCNKQELTELLELYETSVNIIKGVLHE